MEYVRISEDKDRIDTSQPGSLSEISDAAVGDVIGMYRDEGNVNTLKDLLSRLHISVRRKFSEEGRKSILRWQLCPKEIIKALEEIYNAHTENRYQDCLEKAKATLEMIAGFEENKLPYKQELLAYVYCCMALTYVETGDFNKVKEIYPKDMRMATLKSLEMMPAAADQWEVCVLSLEIAKCSLQVENPLYFQKYNRASLNAAINAGDQEMQLYANVLFALIEEIQYRHVMAVDFIKRSLQMANVLKDRVDAVDIQNVLRKMAVLSSEDIEEGSLSFSSDDDQPSLQHTAFKDVYEMRMRMFIEDEECGASPFSSDYDEPVVIHIYSFSDDETDPTQVLTDSESNDETEPKQVHMDSDSKDETEPKQVHMDFDSKDETEPKQVHMGTTPPEETHLKTVDTGSTNTDEHTIPKVIHPAVGMSLPERLGPEGSSEPPSFHPAVSSPDEKSDSSSSGL